jgi:hypothetical protein
VQRMEQMERARHSWRSAAWTSTCTGSGKGFAAVRQGGRRGRRFAVVRQGGGRVPELRGRRARWWEPCSADTERGVLREECRGASARRAA